MPSLQVEPILIKGSWPETMRIIFCSSGSVEDIEARFFEGFYAKKDWGLEGLITNCIKGSVGTLRFRSMDPNQSTLQ